MKHKIEFEKKVSMCLIEIVPFKTIDEIRSTEWQEFLRLFYKPKKKIKITYEWET